MASDLALDDPGLLAFLAQAPPSAAAQLRMLARAWEAGGGRLACGRLVARLVAEDAMGRPFTAASLHAQPPRLEVARILLQGHGVSEAQWQAWSDERPELALHGFEARAKFPRIALAGLPDAALARLAMGVRDLAMAAHGKAASA